MIGLNLDLIMEKTRRAVDIENAMKSVLDCIDRLFDLEVDEKMRMRLAQFSTDVFEIRQRYMTFFEEMERDMNA